jgi:hypothetical protein
VARNLNNSPRKLRILSSLAQHIQEPLLGKIKSLHEEVTQQLFTNTLRGNNRNVNVYEIRRLISHLYPVHLRQVLQETRHYQGDPNEYHLRAELTVRLAQLGYAAEALETSLQLSDGRRGEVLKEILPFLPEESLLQVLSITLDHEGKKYIKYHHEQIWLLAGLAYYLPEQLGTQIAQQVFENLQNRHLNGVSEWGKAQILGDIVQKLPQPLQNQALKQMLMAVWASRKDNIRKAYRTKDYNELGSRMMKLPYTTFCTTWEEMLNFLTHHNRSETLSYITDILIATVDLGGTEATAEIFNTVRDVNRWWP